MRDKPNKISVANPADGGLIYWLFKFYAFGALSLFIIAIAALPIIYLAISVHAPPTPKLSTYYDQAAIGSSIESADGLLLSDLVRKNRQWISIKKIPAMQINALIAAEDRSFYEHHGVDYRGIIRAALANLRAGIVRQGGSTITQQVAKAFLSPERTIKRKALELVLARRIEAQYSKEQIMEFYLNHMFFGNNAYGVKAAADVYFGKALKQLRIGEYALLAGLVRAPSRFSPTRHMKHALARRNQVLKAMLDAGYIDKNKFDAEKAIPIELAEKEDSDPKRWYAPHFTEWVRRRLMRRYGKEKIYQAGWNITTTLDLTLNKRARHYAVGAVEALDKRQGYRGPIMNLRTPKQKDAVLKRMQQLYGSLSKLRTDYPYLALIDDVKKSRVRGRIGTRKIEIPLELMEWAAPYSRTNAENKKTIDDARRALRSGDIVWVVAPLSWMRQKAWGTSKQKVVKMALDQRPRVEGSLFSYDHQSGYVLAMIGGLDFDRSSFNRITQACRQPGSTYKPIYYSLALNDTKHSMGMILQDTPYTPEPGETWNPQNVHGTLDGKVTMHFSLVKSLNLPAIQILASVGYKNAAKWARRLGFTTKIHADKALALGASCVHTDELTRSFATFARGGTQRNPIYIRTISDRNGNLIEDHTHIYDPFISEDQRLDRIFAHSGKKERQVIDPKTAFLTTKLLRDSVLYGIAARCQIVPVPTAGKGGTSSKTMDLWFVGFNSQWATTAWIGDDSYQRMLGLKEASYTSAIPMWANYMKDSVGKRPSRELPFTRSHGLKSTVIDFQTGGPPIDGHRSVEIFYRPKSYTPPQPKADPVGANP